MAPPARCPSCGRPSGSNAGCLTCRDAAARELAAEARDVTDESLRARGEAGRRFERKPPWYARYAPREMLRRVGLFGQVLGDYAAGRYRRFPWRSVAALAAALAYVLSPFDLVPDFLVPVGWTDDMLVMALAWQFVKHDLRAYCAWKGISPAEFGL
jgi:uncharacterized membrane protein YkvA (DUF1232 family)